MDSQTILMCVVALILGMLLFHMLKGVCGCKVVEGQDATGILSIGAAPDRNIIYNYRNSGDGTPGSAKLSTQGENMLMNTYSYIHCDRQKTDWRDIENCYTEDNNLGDLADRDTALENLKNDIETNSGLAAKFATNYHHAAGTDTSSFFCETNREGLTGAERSWSVHFDNAHWPGKCATPPPPPSFPAIGPGS